MTATLISPHDAGTDIRPVRLDHIEGGYIKVPIHQLILMAWLHREGHLTRRQWRICFAALELRERRRHVGDDRKPAYTRRELLRLIGGQGTGVTADLKHLAALGMLQFSERHVDLTASVDRITLADVSGFWEMFNSIANNRRAIPIPRRTIRALAAGFGRATMATMCGLLIRAMYWRREQGGYRIDGRVRREWLAETFGITPRAVTTAFTTLIDLGWIKRIECQQWELNKWGTRFALVPDWTPWSVSESSSPNAGNLTKSSSPCLNSSPSPYGEVQTNSSAGEGHHTTPQTTAANGTGVSKSLSKEKTPHNRNYAGPILHDIQAEDLRCTDRLLALHRQAAEKGLIAAGEGGRLDFVALAERAKTHGQNPPALFAWLLRSKRFDFITLADEDAAHDRLKAHEQDIQPISVRFEIQQEHERQQEFEAVKPTDDDRVVIACLKASQQSGCDPQSIAREFKGWSRQQWETALDAYQERKWRWRTIGRRLGAANG